MTTIKEPTLEKRPAGIGIFFVKDFSPGVTINHSLEVGGTATVKYDGIAVILKINEKIERREFIGEIVGFENIVTETYKDLSVYDLIRFSEENIFGYS